jgi:hypothetical protein
MVDFYRVRELSAFQGSLKIPINQYACQISFHYYQRLWQIGKTKKLALTASIRKPLTILNLMIKPGCP